MEVVEDMITVQQKDRSNEKGERGSNPLCQHRHSQSGKETTEGVLLNTSAGDVFVSV